MESSTESTTRDALDPADPIGVPDPNPSSGPAYDTPGAAPYLAPVPEPAARPKFRLRRSRTDRMLGGVCGGLAESLGVDAAVIRIGLVTLTVLGFGTGVVLYGAIWLLAPETDEP
jgi:phage shock protein PspC (stress-responsive transcriptional regulator)